MSDDAERLRGVLKLMGRIHAGDLEAAGEVNDPIDQVVTGLSGLAEQLAIERQRREEAETLLRDAELAYDHAPGLFCTVAYPSLAVIKCNTTLATALGKEKAQILGQGVVTLHDNTQLESLRGELESIANGMRPPVHKYRLMRADGSSFPVMMSGSAVKDEAGNTLRLRLIWRDITRRRALEAQLMQAQKMEAIGQLASGLAHDLNNLMSVILSCADLALAEVPEEGIVAQDLQTIGTATRRAARLTTDLLAFARQGPLEAEPVRVAQLWETTERLVRKAVSPKVTVEFGPIAPTTVVVIDQHRFEQVMVNLAINADQAMPDGGSLSLFGELRDEDFDAEQYGLQVGCYLVINVRDTGNGIPDDIRSRIFEPFYTTRTETGGTGLGLSMCHGIINQAGGTIVIESTPGQGTCFQVVLPLANDAAVEIGNSKTNVAAIHAIQPQQMTILVVDDQASVRDVAGRILEGAGYNVVRAESGQQALEMLEVFSDTVDLLITDSAMPNMDGATLIRRVRDIWPTMKVLQVSGYNAKPCESDVEVLNKPFGRRSLLTKVDAMLMSTV